MCTVGRYYLTEKNNSLLYHLQMCERIIHHCIILQCVPLGQARTIGRLPCVFWFGGGGGEATLLLCSSITPSKHSPLHYYTQNCIEMVWCHISCSCHCPIVDHPIKVLWQLMWDLWRTKYNWGRFVSEYCLPVKVISTSHSSTIPC
jgi:hypothetical protein